MHLWATRKLADEVAARSVATRDRVAYYVFAQVFYVVAGYASSYGGFHFSWLFLYEALVVAVITFAGAHRVASSYQRPIDSEFFELAYLLSVPLAVKTTAAMWAATYGAYWLAGRLYPHLSVESAESARELSYWLSRLWQLWPFLVAAAIALAFWLRLTHHVRYVIAARGA